MMTRLLLLGISLCLLISALCQASDGTAIPAGKDDAEITKKEQGMLDYYRTQSQWTNPGDQETMFRGLSDDVPSIVKAVQGVLIHSAHVARYGVKPSEAQDGGFRIRRTDELLQRIKLLGDSPLGDVRPPEKRLVVNCRQFAVLTCSILRYKGVPSRVRAGFALWIGTGLYVNHWICEYWQPNEKRWIQVDAQIDEVQSKAMHVTFNTLNLPETAFVCAGEGWQRYRDGKVELKMFGLGSISASDDFGWAMLVSTTVTDIMALNKVELLPWDFNPYWKKKKEQMSEKDTTIIEKAALFSRQVDAHWEEMQTLFNEQQIMQMPADFEKTK